MTLDLSAILGAARRLLQRDRALLLPLSALFIFLPQYAVLLLVPPMLTVDPGATVEAWSQALEPWIAAYGGWYVAATLVTHYGALATVSLYMAPVPNVGGAMGRAAALFLRALLAGILVTLPCGVAALMAMSVPLLPIVVLPGIIYILARATLANPVILGERGTGAVAAIARSWQLTRGHGLAVGVFVGSIMIGGQALSAMVVAVERSLRAGALANPVLLASVDALAAGVAWAAGLALALVQVVLYRRLAR